MADVYQTLPRELRDALRAFEIGALDRIVERRREEDFRALRRLLSSDADQDDRQRAIYALGRWGDPSVVPEIAGMLPALKESQAITAIEALGRLGTEPAHAAVESFADHPSPHVRKFVVEALARIDHARGEAALRRIAERDPVGWVRDLAARRMQARAQKPR